jgi:hypothetical protein
MRKERSNTKRLKSNLDRIWWMYLLFFFTVLFSAGRAYALWDICVPTFDGVTGRPTIDGDISDDIGWTNSTRINLGKDGGVEYRANLRLSKDNNNIFLGVESKRPIGGSASMDVLILRFAPPSGPEWHIQLQPFANGGAVKVWLRDTGHSDPQYHDWQTVPVSPSSWLHVNLAKKKNEAEDMWFVEMKIPRASSATPIDAPDPIGPGIYFDPALEFGFYVNVLNSLEIVIPGFSTQAAWPSDAIITDSVSIEDTNELDSFVQLADSSLTNRPECTGVSLDRFAIGTTNTPDSKIRLYQPGGNPLTLADCPPPPGQENMTNVENTFKALPENNMSNTAQDVKVTYKVATWGIPPLDDKLWYEIGSSGEKDISPTPPPIPANTFHVAWKPTYDESCKFLERTHQCMVAKMISEDVNTRFLNDSARRNMDFVTASTFEREAEISAVGYGEPPEGQGNKHEFLLAVSKRVQRYDKKGDFYVPIGKRVPMLTRQRVERSANRTEAELVPDWSRISWDSIPIPVSIAGKGVREAMTWTMNGFLKTGKYIQIGEKKFQILEDVGGFGYIASHEGAVDKWTTELTGDLDATEHEGLYSIQIEPGQVGRIKTSIEAHQPRGIRRCFQLF